jgi:FAD:protein FMN transferase
MTLTREAIIHHHAFRAMGCQMAAWVLAESEIEARAGLEHVELQVRAWEDRLSRFKPDSELCALNNSSGKWLEVSETLFDVLSRALQAAAATDGLFDPTMLDALEHAGYDRSFELVSDLDDCVPPCSRATPSWTEIEVRPSWRGVRLPQGARVDLGGIGKGWAAEQAADQLADLGPCLVDAGGDLAVRGAPPGLGGWLIGLADPFEPERDLVDVIVRDLGVATSGTDFRRWTRGGVLQHHIIDPRTRRPARTDVLSVSVIARDAIQADVLAKLVVLLGSESGIAYAGNQPGAHALIVTRDGTRLSTPNFPVAEPVRGAAL